MTRRPPDRGQHPRQGGSQVEPPLGPHRAAALPCRRPEGRRGCPRPSTRVRRRGLRDARGRSSSTPTCCRGRRRHPGRRPGARRRSPTRSHPAGVVAVCRHLDAPLEHVVLARSPPAAGRSAPTCATPATPAPSSVRPTRPAPARSCWPGSSVDAYNPKTVRATVGSLFHLPVAVEPDPAAAVLRPRRPPGSPCWPPTAPGRSTSSTPTWPGPPPGSSATRPGACPTSLAALADHRVAIPIHGRAESLNLVDRRRGLPLRQRARPALLTPIRRGRRRRTS